MIIRSLKWQIQAWHTLLLIVIVGGLLTAFYFYERKVQIEALDEKLRAPIHHLLPLFDLPRGIIELREQEAVQGEAFPQGDALEQGSARRRPPRFREGGPSAQGDERMRFEDGSSDRLGPQGQRRPRPGRDGGLGGRPQRRGEPRGYGPPENRQFGDSGGQAEGMRRRPQGGGSDDMGSYGQATMRLAELETNRLKQIESTGMYVIYWRNGEIAYQSEGSPDSVEPPKMSPPQRYLENGHDQIREGSETGEKLVGNGIIYRDNGKYREFLQRSPRGWVMTGISTEVVDEYMKGFAFKLAGLGGAVVIFGVIVGWMMAGRAMKPIKAMSQAATKIAHGDLSQRIDEDNTKNELGQLAQVLNETFGRLDSSFEQQVRFTADASHEMRTPLAVILAKSELALVRERTPEKYQETIKTCYDSAQHMSSLIESLLELARVDSGEFRIHADQGNIGEEVDLCVNMLRPLAEKRGIEVHADIQSINMAFDLQRIKQVIINLLSNAVKYNHENGEIFVTVAQEQDSAVIKIKDTGPGIKAEDLKHIFNRFYRVDKSRNAKQGSTGLGLAISKAIVAAHHGRIEAESVYGQGTTFILRLPI